MQSRPEQNNNENQLDALKKEVLQDLRYKAEDAIPEDARPNSASLADSQDLVSLALNRIPVEDIHALNPVTELFTALQKADIYSFPDFQEIVDMTDGWDTVQHTFYDYAESVFDHICKNESDFVIHLHNAILCYETLLERSKTLYGSIAEFRLAQINFYVSQQTYFGEKLTELASSLETAIETAKEKARQQEILNAFTKELNLEKAPSVETDVINDNNVTITNAGENSDPVVDAQPEPEFLAVDPLSKPKVEIDPYDLLTGEDWTILTASTPAVSIIRNVKKQEHLNDALDVLASQINSTELSLQLSEWRFFHKKEMKKNNVNIPLFEAASYEATLDFSDSTPLQKAFCELRMAQMSLSNTKDENNIDALKPFVQKTITTIVENFKFSDFKMSIDAMHSLLKQAELLGMEKNELALKILENTDSIAVVDELVKHSLLPATQTVVSTLRQYAHYKDVMPSSYFQLRNSIREALTKDFSTDTITDATSLKLQLDNIDKTNSCDRDKKTDLFFVLINLFEKSHADIQGNKFAQFLLAMLEQGYHVISDKTKNIIILPETCAALDLAKYGVTPDIANWDDKIHGYLDNLVSKAEATQFTQAQITGNTLTQFGNSTPKAPLQNQKDEEKVNHYASRFGLRHF